MSKKIKLLWDFKGLDALATAKHHAIHLREFAERENLNYHIIETKIMNECYAIAYIVVNDSHMKLYRDALKPHRGELA